MRRPVQFDFLIHISEQSIKYHKCFFFYMALGDVPTDQLPEMMELLLGDFWTTLAPVVEWLSWLLGGFFGLYLLYFLIKLYFDRKRIQILKEVRKDVEFLKEHSLNVDELSKLRVIINGYSSVQKKKVVKKKKKKSKK